MSDMHLFVRREFALAPVLIHRIGARDRARAAALGGYLERLLRELPTTRTDTRLIVGQLRPALGRWMSAPSAVTGAEVARLLDALDAVLGAEDGLTDEVLEVLPA